MAQSAKKGVIEQQPDPEKEKQIKKLAMLNYNTEQVEMLVSDVSIKFNRKLGFAHRRDVDIQKLINLSKQIYKSYYDDNVKMKRKL